MTRLGWMRRATEGGLKRVAIALFAGLIGAWMTSTVTLPAFVVAAGLVSGNLDPLEAAASPFLAVVWLPFVAVPAVSAAIAVHLSMAALGMRGAGGYALAGAVVGSGLMAVFFSCTGVVEMTCAASSQALLFGAVMGGVPGLGGALTFWAVLRPDQPPLRPEAINA